MGYVLAVALPAQGQSLRKLERQAINRTHLTFVNGDTVQRCTVTDERPAPRANRFYYWQGPAQILRTVGAYNGRLLMGDYQLTSRNGNLLASGSFDKGLKTGEWRTWRLDGTPVSSSVWRRGRQWGKTKYYDETGRQVRPPMLPKPMAPATISPVTPHFWQPVYWRQAWQQRQQRHAEKQKALSSKLPLGKEAANPEGKKDSKKKAKNKPEKTAPPQNGTTSALPTAPSSRPTP
jgi:hypothetical protein